MKVAYYNFSHWYKSKDEKLSLYHLLNIPIEFDLIEYHHADIIFVRNIISSSISRDIVFNRKITFQERIEIMRKELVEKLTGYKASPFLNKRSIVCSTVFGNTTKERVMACKAFSYYKPVDIYGKNPISNRGRYDGNVSGIFNDSRFAICFENFSAYGYITEKLFNAIVSQTIPIYWGAIDITKYCNIDSLIHCKNNKDIRNLGKKISNMSNIDIQNIQECCYFSSNHIEHFIQSYKHMHTIFNKICNIT